MLTTAGITADFAAGARVGGWLAFASCHLACNGERIVHALAGFVRSGDRPCEPTA